MAKIDVLDQMGKVVDSIELNDEVFGIEPHQQALYDVLVMQAAGKRQGTSKTKGRSEVRGGGRKPYRQKGTGRARQGSIRSPQWRGGGVVFGPTPRSYGYKLPQKVRRLALKSVYSAKVAEEKFVAVESLSFAAPKTAEFANVLSALNVDSKVLVILEEGNEFAALSARNLPNVKVATATTASVLDIVNSDKLLVTKEAISTIEEVLA